MWGLSLSFHGCDNVPGRSTILSPPAAGCGQGWVVLVAQRTFEIARGVFPSGLWPWAAVTPSGVSLQVSQGAAG